ncbi:hypothetical protein QBC33DRAFT_622581 [Phialemonium atrogriseum]|uniref:Uncharacterized protein n=1 Tax=Phialemonium atrogriseum TaxID=1093897 RepID=A0AAJ0BSW1_9PEZI|nr:uncharacterized protein QBC33DRAFT_622581 [Phialemonium atrogriseum]KAK1763869.1 hypothetical protein QBC33DRAFT_622581 [Phialemonium atrogriseum]
MPPSKAPSAVTSLDTIQSNPRHVGLPLRTHHQAAILLQLFQAGKTPAHKLELLNPRSAFTAAQLLECGLATAPQRIRDAFGLSVATLVKKATPQFPLQTPRSAQDAEAPQTPQSHTPQMSPWTPQSPAEVKFAQAKADCEAVEAQIGQLALASPSSSLSSGSPSVARNSGAAQPLAGPTFQAQSPTIQPPPSLSFGPAVPSIVPPPVPAPAPIQTPTGRTWYYQPSWPQPVQYRPQVRLRLQLRFNLRHNSPL